jgi:hypothetical protein
VQNLRHAFFPQFLTKHLLNSQFHGYQGHIPKILGGKPAALPLIFGENYTVYLPKGKKKLDVISIFAKNCTILKNFLWGSYP